MCQAHQVPMLQPQLRVIDAGEVPLKQIPWVLVKWFRRSMRRINIPATTRPSGPALALRMKAIASARPTELATQRFGIGSCRHVEARWGSALIYCDRLKHRLKHVLRA
jgi:hypothetical protein